MAKKFGKFLLFTAAVAATAAGVYYFLKKKSGNDAIFEIEDDDYDDFSEDLDEPETREYVQLEPGALDEDDFLVETDEAAEGDFSPLAEQLQEKNNEQVEEFFGEEN